jgi:hypothetical protein
MVEELGKGWPAEREFLKGTVPLPPVVGRKMRHRPRVLRHPYNYCKIIRKIYPT